MPRFERWKIISDLEKLLQSYVITYVTSTRDGLGTQMSMDALPKLYEHLRPLGQKKVPVDLFLHSNGGDGTVPWRLVTLLREYASSFRVLVPHRAFSAATLTALGADRIIMHPMGMLGPTDPTVTTPFNPPHPAAPGQVLGINVEDVTAYIALIKEDAGVTHEEELAQLFGKLADKVHPLALGSVKRFLSQSRMMAKKLLALHMDAAKDRHKIEHIVDSLTSKLFFHAHPINRDEARGQVGLENVENASLEVEDLVWRLYGEYDREMRLSEPFQALAEFNGFVAAQSAAGAPVLLVPGGPVVRTPPSTTKLVYIESVNRCDVSTWEYELAGQLLPNGATNLLTLQRNQGWILE